MKSKMAISGQPGQFAGRTLRQIMEDVLLTETRKYLDMRAVPLPDLDLMGDSTAIHKYMQAEKLLVTQRGIVRGAALQVLALHNPYLLDMIDEVRKIEREFTRKAKRA